MTIVGALVFGIVVGYITYRTLIRTEQTAITDLTAVIAAIGGGAVTKLFVPSSDAFGWYAIGLAAGMLAFFLIFWKLNGKTELAKVMIVETSGDGPAHESGNDGPQA